MKLDVVFESSNSTFDATLHSVVEATDGGYKQGYEVGYNKGYPDGYEASQKTIVLQDKTVRENGKVTADEGFTGLKEVNVAIPIKEEQEKSLTITEN